MVIPNKIQFIAADMDGTLLNDNGQLDPEFFNVYRELEKKDIIFATASGRQYYSLCETFSSVKDTMMFIAENGTLVMYKGKELYSCTMDSDVVADIIRVTRGIPFAHIVLCGKKSAYIETRDTQALDEIKKYYHRCHYVDDLLTVDDEFIKVAICHFSGSEKNLYPVIDPKFGLDSKVVISAKHWLDVMNIEASKGCAIAHLRQCLGFTFEQTMSFGDYFNDIEMLKESYYSYAMENAHPEVKQHARFLAPSNQHSGVVTIINEYLKSTA